ncbi:MAG: Uma2 family endonuclease [Chloroflexota bacterium]
MVLQERILTVAEFDDFVRLPDHGDTQFELIDKQVCSKKSTIKSSQIAMTLGILVGAFVREHGLGYITGADGGYQVSGQRYIPDVAFVSKARQAEPSDETYSSIAPDLAIEVVSPTDSSANVRIKLTNYLNAGTVVWIVDPSAKTVEVYTPEKSPKKLSEKDTLSGGDVLPDFAVIVKEIFA